MGAALTIQSSLEEEVILETLFESLAVKFVQKGSDSWSAVAYGGTRYELSREVDANSVCVWLLQWQHDLTNPMHADEMKNMNSYVDMRLAIENALVGLDADVKCREA